MAEPPLPELSVRPAERFVHRRWCLWLAIALVLLGVITNTIYLWNHCALDLSEDESHYWEWARHLDYGYYSKPAGIAWVIWGAVKIGKVAGVAANGAAMMPVVRMPAVLFGLCSGLLSLFLARRMFRDDRASLAVILLSAAVPMFAVGSLLITIDSPMYLCWAGTVFCLWRAVEGNVESAEKRRGIGWLYAAGAVSCAGMLFKPVLIAIPPCAAVAAWVDPIIRRTLRTWHALGALVVMLLSLVPMLVWNSHHGWVMFRHIATQGGLAGGEEESGSKISVAVKHLGSFVGAQAGGMGGIMFVLLVIAVVLAFRWTAQLPKSNTTDGAPPPDIADRMRERSVWVFLICMSVPLWGFYFVMNFWKGTEPNWPAASYFAGMILLAGVLVRQWNSPVLSVRRGWRMWGVIAVGLGILMSQVAMNLERFYPLAERNLAPLAGTERYNKSIWYPGKWDPAAKKLRGFEERAAAVEKVVEQLREQTGEEPMVITTRYDTSSSLAFYLPGQPFVYCIMSEVGGRHSQYDLWRGVDQRDASGGLANAGRPAVIIGLGPNDKALERVIRPGFERIEGPVKVPVVYQGIVLSEMWVAKGYGFKGLPMTTSSSY